MTDDVAVGPLVVLTGPPGAGKSTVGELLAARFGAVLLDTDAEVAAAAGKPAGDIFIEDGEDAFRALERAAVTRALDAAGAVVALGSGAVLDESTRRRLAGQRVVYLAAGFPVLVRRLGFDRPRVVVPGNPRGQLRRMLEQRRPVYEGLADLTVDAGDLAPEEVADEIAVWLAEGPAARSRDRARDRDGQYQAADDTAEGSASWRGHERRVEPDS